MIDSGWADTYMHRQTGRQTRGRQTAGLTEAGRECTMLYGFSPA